ncbi:DUF554 domain-containing protein [Adlercreutzia sp. ZJ304]|uniref:DUF554 domain-containing protein n=1 Tax=Adlercreutzia sp. ZJ304 TaxID=2709791 RepID=UPI0013E9F7C0|nr:DUF554 domain-containing protein [Adlercreutzia sp. ZJ304]
MIGTIANTIAIIIGSIIGSAAKRGLGQRYQDILFAAMGLAAVGIGINAVVVGMADSIYPVLFIASLAIGGVIGTGLDISGRFDKLVSKHSKQDSEGKNLSQGLSTAIMLFCFGTLSILGPINSALYGDETYLFTNATLDFVTSMVLASSFGIGIALAAVVLFCWQGAIFLLANQLAPLLTSQLMCEITIVGGFLILASGLGILKIKDIPTMNLLPALFVPPIWFAAISLASNFGLTF